MITIPQLTEVQDIGDTDVVMITHSDGTSKKIAGQNILSAGTNTVMATSTSITGPALKTGMGIKVFFTVALTGSNTTTPLALTYNSVSKTVKVPKDGALVDFCAVEVSSGVYKYLQAYTTLELLYDGTNFVIIGNPVVISSADYTIYADGIKTDNQYIKIKTVTGTTSSGGQLIVPLDDKKQIISAICTSNNDYYCIPSHYQDTYYVYVFNAFNVKVNSIEVTVKIAYI